MSVSPVLRALLLLSLALCAGTARAQGAAGGSGNAAPPGSGAFCLFEVPSDDAGKRRMVNLAHVQYVEINGTDVRLYFGGGNFGAGHEARIPAASAAEAQAVLDRLRRTAASCMNYTRATP